jgi:hypothetical protein
MPLKIMSILTWLKRYWWISLVLLIAYLWLRTGRQERTPMKDDKAIEVLQGALKESMSQTNRLIDLHEKNTAVWQSLITTNHARIDTDKKKTDEKINRVRQYSADDIKRYFSGLDDMPAQ